MSGEEGSQLSLWLCPSIISSSPKQQQAAGSRQHCASSAALGPRAPSSRPCLQPSQVNSCACAMSLVVVGNSSFHPSLWAGWMGQ